MILTLALALILIGLVVFMVAVVSIGGTILTVMFSDVIVCIAIIAGIIYLINRRRR